MKTYQFETSATMKPYNYKSWWIDSGIIRKITVDAPDLKKALDEYREIVKDKYYIEISKSAIKNRQPMYRDTASGDALQVGYVITAATDFDSDGRGWVTQYIDLWVTVNEIVNPFEEITQ